MSQSLTLSFSGIFTSLSDYQGLPPGACNIADNVESRYKNVAEPRRGFETLPNSAMSGVYLKRISNFPIAGVDRVVGLTSQNNLVYYSGANPWPAIPGDVVTNILPPDPINGKSRFISAGQNLYVTAQDGIRSLSSGPASTMLRAGVPKGLDLSAETNGDLDGFFGTNVVTSTTGKIASGVATITNLNDTSGIEVGQYVTGIEIPATRVIQDITYNSQLFGVLGNAISIAYATGGVAGSEIVTVVGNAITVTMQTGVSTATQISTKILASPAAVALVGLVISGTAGTAQTAVGATLLTGGLDNSIPEGTKVSSVDTSESIIIQTGTTTAGSATVSALASSTGVVAGVLVTGAGIPDGAKVVSISGAGPYSISLDTAAIQTATGVSLTFSTPVVINLDQNAVSTLTSTVVIFYRGSQVAYRMVFGRVENDIDGGSVTRLSAPSTQAIVTNGAYPTNVTVIGTLPKNASNEITFVQLYRSAQTADVDITPLDQYSLVYERKLVASDFISRRVTILDEVPDSLMGISLYTGSDQEGISQANFPPPMAWDVCKFRDFILYGNVTRPSTLSFTILSVSGASGIQIGDTITISGSFLGVGFSEVYTASAAENLASKQFKIYTSGTTSQNISDTADSLIRVINYDEDLPIHAVLISTESDLPGQINLESDNPSYDIFTITASAHVDAYDPSLDDLDSDINTTRNGICISKSGELEAVPALNILNAGDSSSDVLRLIPLRDYVIVLKTDGIYKIQGLTPSGLVVNPFDLTTKIIGADTAVSLNSGVWMLSNQGVVSISDGGVDAKSVPIDDQLNRRIGSYIDNLINCSFAIGYESDRKYILSVPDSDNEYSEVQYCFNYVTSAWTTWSRNFYSGFIHSEDGKLYVGRADPLNFGLSKERKTATYTDYVDEAAANVISAVAGTVVTLDDISDVIAGDVLYQSASLFSPIIAVDLAASTATVQYAVGFTAGAVSILKAYECNIEWKQVFGDNPAFMRQFSEGMFLFKNTRFNAARAGFVTDFSQALENVDLVGSGTGLWGLFSWGDLPWGGTIIPSKIRFYIPQNKQIATYLIPSLKIQQGFSDFKVLGLSISYYPISQESGL
jgi:hypothetical protein